MDWESFGKYPWITAAKVDYGAVDGLRNHLPDGMMAVANQGPLFSGVWRLNGRETFSYALCENQNLIQSVYQRVNEISVQVAEASAQKEWVGALWLGDDEAYDKGLLTSPAVFRNYTLPYYRRIDGICQRYNKLLIYHSDGNLLAIMEDLIAEVGIAALHPIEPKAMDIGQIKHNYGHRVALIGNVDVDLLCRGTPEMVALETQRLWRDSAPGGGFLLGSSNSVPCYASLENYQAMLDRLCTFGRYPISL